MTIELLSQPRNRHGAGRHAVRAEPDGAQSQCAGGGRSPTSIARISDLRRSFAQVRGYISPPTAEAGPRRATRLLNRGSVQSRVGPGSPATRTRGIGRRGVRGPGPGSRTGESERPGPAASGRGEGRAGARWPGRGMARGRAGAGWRGGPETWGRGEGTPGGGVEGGRGARGSGEGVEGSRGGGCRGGPGGCGNVPAPFRSLGYPPDRGSRHRQGSLRRGHSTQRPKWTRDGPRPTPDAGRTGRLVNGGNGPRRCGPGCGGPGRGRIRCRGGRGACPGGR